MPASRKRPSAVALNLLAKPGSAPVRSTPVEDYPRGAHVAAIRAEPGGREAVRNPHPGGIKAATVGTTVYLLPSEHKRVKRLALDLDVASVHELLLLGLDKLLAEEGSPPIARYAQPRPKKG
jgi:hypothetical protein